MPSIQVLDQNTINQIAAGEVIERPASVVKELLENAIDAKATAVTVEIKDGGISLIRITDNGCGIKPEEIPLAFLRHSTSKIRSVEDLLTVSSLGFRGEALSSIAAVSQVELITKLPEALHGSRYMIEGGEEKLSEEIGCPEGTTFLVKNLFFNTPARRKFLKTSQTEAGYIAEMVERIALSHPEISIRFIQNNQNKLHTSGNSNQKDVIYQVYGREITANLLPIKREVHFGSVEGYIGKPVVARGNRSFEHCFVNGRYIKSQMIQRAIEDAYQPYMMQHKYPFVVLNLTIRANLLDINVHPAKLELRFSNSQEVFEFIKTSITQVLEHKELIPEVSLHDSQKKPFQPILQNTEAVQNRKTIQETAVSQDTKYPENHTIPRDMEKVTEPKIRRAPEPFEVKRAETVKEHISFEEKEEGLAVQMEFSSMMEVRSKHRIIGQLFQTYWLVEYEDRLFLIDQHAAHEKVLYEQIIKGLKNKEYGSQLLHPPIIVTLDLKQEALYTQKKESFTSLGFEIEPFGGREYAISAVPNNLFGLISKEVFIEMLDQLSEECRGGAQTMVTEKIASMSCKAAVKGRHRLSTEEAESLIEQLLCLENPYFCPHGRPTIIAMTKTELERKFKRIL